MVEKVKASELARQERNRGAVLMQEQPGVSDDNVIARKLTKPEINAASVVRAWTGENHDINALAAEFEAQSAAVRRGDMGRAEEMLIAQAHALNEIFAALARRSRGLMDSSAAHFELCMRLAFKAQSQCRATLETLAEVKNPMAGAYIRQANVAAGHQQVNNSPDGSRVRETENQPNKLLEGTDELRQNTGTQALEGRANKTLETVGEIHRAQDRIRKVAG